MNNSSHINHIQAMSDSPPQNAEHKTEESAILTLIKLVKKQ